MKLKQLNEDWTSVVVASTLIFAIVATPDFKAAMEKNGADAVHNTTEQFANLVKIEAGKYGNIVKKLGIKLD